MKNKALNSPVGHEMPCWYNKDEIEAADINSGKEKRDEQNPFFGFLYLTEHASRQGSGMGSHLHDWLIQEKEK